MHLLCNHFHLSLPSIFTISPSSISISFFVLWIVTLSQTIQVYILSSLPNSIAAFLQLFYSIHSIPCSLVIPLLFQVAWTTSYIAQGLVLKLVLQRHHPHSLKVGKKSIDCLSNMHFNVVLHAVFFKVDCWELSWYLLTPTPILPVLNLLYQCTYTVLATLDLSFSWIVLQTKVHSSDWISKPSLLLQGYYKTSPPSWFDEVSLLMLWISFHCQIRLLLAFLTLQQTFSPFWWVLFSK